MPALNNHYKTLGVSSTATQKDIKKAYQRLARIHHPDKGGDTALFQKIQDAYKVLSNGSQEISKPLAMPIDPSKPLSLMVAMGDIDGVRDLLEKIDCDVNEKTVPGGATPLIWAIINKRYFILKELLHNKKINVNTSNDLSLTPLMISSMLMYDKEATEQLIFRGAECVNIEKYFCFFITRKYNSFIKAYQERDIKKIEKLIKHTPNLKDAFIDNQPAIYHAMQENDVALASLLYNENTFVSDRVDSELSKLSGAIKEKDLCLQESILKENPWLSKWCDDKGNIKQFLPKTQQVKTTWLQTIKKIAPYAASVAIGLMAGGFSPIIGASVIIVGFIASIAGSYYFNNNSNTNSPGNAKTNPKTEYNDEKLLAITIYSPENSKNWVEKISEQRSQTAAAGVASGL